MRPDNLSETEVAQSLVTFAIELPKSDVIAIGAGSSVGNFDEFGNLYVEHDRYENVVKRAIPWRHRCFTVILASGADGAGWLTPNGRLRAEDVLGPLDEYHYGVNPELDDWAEALFRAAFIEAAARAARSAISEIRIMVSIRDSSVRAEHPEAYESIVQA